MEARKPSQYGSARLASSRSGGGAPLAKFSTAGGRTDRVWVTRRSASGPAAATEKAAGCTLSRRRKPRERFISVIMLAFGPTPEPASASVGLAVNIFILASAPVPSSAAVFGVLDREMLNYRSNHDSLRVAGFGACMISGYPHKADGFFNIACTHLAEDLACSVESKIFTYGGFPAPRAEKYLKPKVIAYAPTYIVIQFAGLDALCPVRRRSLSVRGASGTNVGGRARTRYSDASDYHGKQATSWSRLRWELASILGYFRKLEAITPLSVYLLAMERMIDSCIAADVTPIVLTPFVYGSRYSMRSGLTYANALRNLIAKKRGAILLDCIEVLRAYPKHMVLQHDGFHLSQNGHALVGIALAQQIIAHLKCAEKGLPAKRME